MRTNTNIKGMKPTITGTITFDNSTTMSLVNTDFLAGSFCIKDGTSNSGEFTVGGAVIRGCSFTLLNDSGRFNNLNWFNSKVSITLTFPNNTTLMFSGFYVVSHKETGRRINVETYTAMKLLDEYEIYEHNFTYPTTASSAVGTIATARGLTVTGMAYPNMSIPDPGDDTLTEREFISYIAQMMGQFVTIEGTVMRFDWYDFTSTYNAGTTFSHDLRTSDVTITGVKVTANDGTTVATQGSSGYMLNITDNPLITASNASTVATQIYGAVNGITFRPGTVQIESNAAIEAGDVISVFTGRETVTMIATTLTYKTTLKESITADADPQDGDLRVTRSQRIAKTIQKEAVKTIDQQLADSTSPLSQAIASGGGGSGGGVWDSTNNRIMKVGGPSNSYSLIRTYDNNDNLLMNQYNGGTTVYKVYGAPSARRRMLDITENGLKTWDNNTELVTIDQNGVKLDSTTKLQLGSDTTHEIDDVVKNYQNQYETQPMIVAKRDDAGEFRHIWNNVLPTETHMMMELGHKCLDANDDEVPVVSGIEDYPLGRNVPVEAHAFVDIDPYCDSVINGSATATSTARLFRIKHGNTAVVDITSQIKRGQAQAGQLAQTTIYSMFRKADLIGVPSYNDSLVNIRQDLELSDYDNTGTNNARYTRSTMTLGGDAVVIKSNHGTVQPGTTVNEDYVESIKMKDQTTGTIHYVKLDNGVLTVI